MDLADVARQINHLLLSCFDDRPRLFVKLRRGFVDVEVVFERPVVLGFSHREMICSELRFDLHFLGEANPGIGRFNCLVEKCLRHEVAQPAICFSRLFRGIA